MNEQTIPRIRPAVEYGVMEALREGDTGTKLSALVMGLGNILHRQVGKGLIFLAAEIAYLFFMIRYGFHNIAMLPGLGTVERQEV